MHPLLWHNPLISSYGALILAGIILSWLLLRALAKRTDVPLWKIDYLVPLVAFVSLLGAHLFGSLTDTLTASHVGGTVLLGSLCLATAAGILYAKLLHIPLGTLGDLVAAPIMFTLAFGRLGCFFAGCCFGQVCDPSFPLALTFPQNSFPWHHQLSQGLLSPQAAASLPVYPVQLAEALIAAAVGGLCWFLFSRRGIAGELFLLMALLYTAVRFLLEFLRADNPPLLGPLTFSQTLTPLLFIAAAITLLLRRARADAWALRL